MSIEIGKLEQSVNCPFCSIKLNAYMAGADSETPQEDRTMICCGCYNLLKRDDNNQIVAMDVDEMVELDFIEVAEMRRRAKALNEMFEVIEDLAERIRSSD